MFHAMQPVQAYVIEISKSKKCAKNSRFYALKNIQAEQHSGNLEKNI